MLSISLSAACATFCNDIRNMHLDGGSSIAFYLSIEMEVGLDEWDETKRDKATGQMVFKARPFTSLLVFFTY
jgi:hypothetical protein